MNTDRHTSANRSHGSRPRWLSVLSLCALIAAPTAVPLAESARTFAIVGARIIDGSGREPFEGTVLVRDGRIAQASPNVDLPANVRVIDGQGKTVLPGLFDLHVHLFGRGVARLTPDLGKHLAAYLYSGVTTVAELGTSPTHFAAVREALRSGMIQGPHVALAARLAVPGGHGTEGGWPSAHTQHVSTPEEAREAVDRVAAYQPDLLKVFADGWRYGVNPDLASMDLDTLEALTNQARKHGLRVLTHTVTAQGARVAADGGVAVIGHGIGDEVADTRLANGLRQRNMTYVPTLSVYEPRDRRRWTPLLWHLVERPTRERLEEDAAAATGSQGNGVQAAAVRDPSAAAGQGNQLAPREKRWRVLTDNVAKLREQGVRFAVGTDAGITGTPHGWSTLREVQLLTEAGLTPLEAMTAATGNSAWALGVQEDRGFIVSGKRADLLLVDGDPVADIAAIERVEHVFLDGRDVDRAALERLMTGEAPTPVPTVRVTGPLIDDFERQGGQTVRGTRWIDRTERGAHPSRVSISRVARGGGHALRLAATMSDAKAPFARLSVPLAPGGLQPVDASRFRGIRFEARGEGRYRVVFETRGVRDEAYHESSFAASSKWIPVAIHFESVSQPRSSVREPWTGKDLMAIRFEIEREPGSSAWLEIDNLKFY
ncbi:MAG: amidohydrolase family protein [Luteitalea sp.]|nr:amidohydrolase family protein [Luteitalea sp.]